MHAAIWNNRNTTDGSDRVSVAVTMLTSNIGAGASPMVKFHNTPACRNMSIGEATDESKHLSAARIATFFIQSCPNQTFI